MFQTASFLHPWYRELNRRRPDYRPYWYRNHETPDAGGSYFGSGCIEAVAAGKAFGLEDSLCLGYPPYPGDLLRPDGLTTQASSPEAIG